MLWPLLCCGFVSFLSKYFLIPFVIPSLTHRIFFLRLFKIFHVFLSFPVFLQFFLSSFVLLWLEKIVCMILLFFSLLGLASWTIQGLSWRMFHMHVKKSVFCSYWVQCSVFAGTHWFLVGLKSSVSLLNLGLALLSIFESEACKSPNTILEQLLFLPSSL